MMNYIVNRLLQAIMMLLILSIGFFTLLHALPGGPEAVLFNPHLTNVDRLALRHHYGLDQPLPVQYFAWLTNSMHGDFGNSFATGQPVVSEIAARLPATLELFLASFLFALVIAIIFGAISAVKQYSLADYLITALAYFGIAMPTFWFGLTLQTIFGVQFHFLPVFGRTALDTTGFTPLEVFADGTLHLILPAIVLSFSFIAAWSRFFRSSMLDVIKQDYIRTARAKGLSFYHVIFFHALRNASIPLLTQVALDLGSVFSGAVITETVFAWPGLGRLFYDSLGTRDYPVLLAMLLIGAVSVIFFNLVADVLYPIVDPRIRYS